MSSAHACEIESLHEGYAKDMTELEGRLEAAEAGRERAARALAEAEGLLGARGEEESSEVQILGAKVEELEGLLKRANEKENQVTLFRKWEPVLGAC